MTDPLGVLLLIGVCYLITYGMIRLIEADEASVRSSAEEYLPPKEKVEGSNPSGRTPTTERL